MGNILFLILTFFLASMPFSLFLLGWNLLDDGGEVLMFFGGIFTVLAIFVSNIISQFIVFLFSGSNNDKISN